VTGLTTADAAPSFTGLTALQHSGDIESDLEIVLAFLNTVDVEQGTDQLASAAAWAQWVSLNRLGMASEVSQAIQLRDQLRKSIGDPRLERPIPDLADSTHLGVTLSAGRPTLLAHDAVGEILASSARLVILGHWDRFKICSAEHCRWAFFDRSRNQSRTWCSMRVCGNREKARLWRERAKSNVA
jgi:predicted RNA-binding Zn ribbon-like protein